MKINNTSIFVYICEPRQVSLCPALECGAKISTHPHPSPLRGREKDQARLDSNRAKLSSLDKGFWPSQLFLSLINLGA